MEKYSKAVSAMYSQFKQREDHPLKKYVGRLAKSAGTVSEVVGYRYNELTREPWLIIDASRTGGWSVLPSGVIFKECESYWYVSIHDLID